MNIAKTKDMIIDFRKRAPDQEVTILKGQKVEYVDKYKYLGTVIDNKLNFEANCGAVCKKGSPAPVLSEEIVSVPPRQNHADLVLSCFYQICFILLSCVLVWESVT